MALCTLCFLSQMYLVYLGLLTTCGTHAVPPSKNVLPLVIEIEFFVFILSGKVLHGEPAITKRSQDNSRRYQFKYVVKISHNRLTVVSDHHDECYLKNGLKVIVETVYFSLTF